MSSQIETASKPSPNRKIEVLVNPNAGSTAKVGRFIRHVNADLPYFKSKGDDVTIRVTENANQAKDLAKSAASRCIDGIAVYGGDGSVRTVVEGLVEGTSDKPSDTRPSLYLLGGGTANLGVRKIWERPVFLPDPVNVLHKLLLHGQETPTDVGELKVGNSVHNFLFLAGSELNAKVMQGSESKKSKVTKVATIASKTLKTARKYEGHNVTLTTIKDGEEIEKEKPIDNMSLIEFINAGSLGGLFSLSDSKLNDGVMEAAYIEGLHENLIRLVKIVPHAILRNLIPKLPKLRDFQHREGTHFILKTGEGEEPFQTQADGDYIEETSPVVEVRVLPKRLSLMTYKLQKSTAITP